MVGVGAECILPYKDYELNIHCLFLTQRRAAQITGWCGCRVYPTKTNYSRTFSPPLVVAQNPGWCGCCHDCLLILFHVSLPLKRRE